MKIEGLSTLASQGYAAEAKGARSTFGAGRSVNVDTSVLPAGGSDDSSNYSIVESKEEKTTASGTLGSAVSDLNEELAAQNVALRFRVDQETKDVIVSVIDKESEEVIREIPPEEVVKMRERMKKMAGLLLEKTV